MKFFMRGLPSNEFASGARVPQPGNVRTPACKSNLILLLCTLLFSSLACTGQEINKEEIKPEDKMLTFRDQLFGVYAAGSNHVWAVGDFGTILHSDSGGRSWIRQDSGTPKALLDVDFTDPGNGWVVGEGGMVLKTSDGGKRWIPRPSGTENRLMSVDFITPQKGIAVGVFGTILRTDDGGETWLDRSLGDDVVLNEVFFADSDKAWIVGEFGIILESWDSGNTWTKQDSGIGEASLFGVGFLDDTHGWAVGQDGILLRTENGGKEWMLRQERFGKSLFDIAVNPFMGYIVGADGLVLEKRNGWMISDRVISFSWLRDIALAGKTGWMVGGRGMILKTSDAGESWEFVTVKPKEQNKAWPGAEK